MTNKLAPTLFFTVESFLNWRITQKSPIGLIPTMGNLHAGHLRLVEEALTKYDCCVVSIFVNPTQFGPKDDFERYPRTLDQDCQQLSELYEKYPDKQLVIFAPSSASEVYNDDFSFSINPGELAQIIEGQCRPGHFQGVCTVITILLNLVKPRGLFLGKKDYQQLRILEKLVRNLKFDVEVIGIETVRSPKGLALSSRNNYLQSDEEIKLAEQFPVVLKDLEKLLIESWNENQYWSPEKIVALVQNFCSQYPFSWDYCELRQQDLSILSEHSSKVVLLAVIKVGTVRLIDNREFEVKIS